MSQARSPAPRTAFATETYLPASFRARGVAVPFTTPQLAGARARAGARDRPELILPNPSGKAGVYVVPWQEIGTTCRPSLHDSRLSALIGELPSITPAAVRESTRAVCAAGFAGREAMAAAHAAAARDAVIRAVRHRALRQALLAGPTPAEADFRTIDAALGCLAQCFIGIGTGDEDDAPLVGLLAGLAQLQEAVTAHAATHDDVDAAPLLHVAGLTLAYARAALDSARQQAVDIPDLLRRWHGSRDDLIDLLARPDWLLDGWGHLCALWRKAEPHRRSVAVMEMTSVMPLLPAEVEAWMAQPVDLGNQLARGPGRMAMRQEWRSGVASQDVVARNEALLAATL